MRLSLLYKWILLSLLSLCLWTCENDKIINAETSDYTADFDSVWTNYEVKYPLFEFKGVDWSSIYNEYHDAFKDITVYERNDLIVEMLSVFKDEHIVLETSDGEYLSTYTNLSYTRNYNDDFISGLTGSINWHVESTGWGWGKLENMGYINFLNIYSGSLDTIRFDMALDSLRECDGIIIDIRKNQGGNLVYAAAVWNRFTEQEIEVGYQLYREGPLHNDYAPAISVITHPRGDWHYLKPVAVLTGRFCGSVGEIVAETFSHFEHAVIIGDTTRGSVEAPSGFYLSDGLKYPVPIVAYYGTDGEPLEWNGVAPDIYIDPALTSSNTSEDAVIDEAIAYIKTRLNL